MAQKKAKSYRVRYELDEDGWWVATVPSVPGCHTQGRTIEQARHRIEEALLLYDDRADRAVLEDEIVLPDPVQVGIRDMQAAVDALERQRALLDRRRRDLAVRLLKLVSVRDAGTILGVSGERVRQIANAPPVAPPVKRATRERTVTK